MKYGKKRSHSGAYENPNPEKRGKHGRKEMRNVTRTTRRGNHEEEGLEDKEHEEEEEQVEVSEDEQEEKKSSDIPAGAAYDALLVLLKSEQKSNIAKKKKKIAMDEKVEEEVDSEAEAEEEEEVDENEIAGANVDSEDDEEEEEIGEIEVDNENEEDDSLDPFESHFNNQDDSFLDKQQKLIEERSRWPIRSKEQYPKMKYSSIFQTLPDIIPAPTSKNSTLEDFKFIKQRVRESYLKSNSNELSQSESTLLQPMLNYEDVNFPYKSFDNNSFRKLYLLHVLNHINKTRDRVIKNNNKSRTYQESLKEGKINSATEEPELRDQGFTRPKVLILLPTKEACYDVIEQLIQISGSEQQENKSKLKRQFHDDSIPPEYKPDDFRDAFKGNNNDFFCLGVKFTRKTVKLYSSFYTSDIILASPIGLSMILENPDKKKRQYDFLSSIEILIIDKAHQIEMQNWDHVNTVMKYVNKIPKEFHDADFSRIRMWCINDQLRLLRQNLIFSEYSTPNINNFITSKSNNVQGKWKFKPNFDNDSCIMNSIGIKLKQIFHRFESAGSPLLDPDARFKFFINTILPSITKTTSYEDGLMIYIPSYYDYLRVKEHLMNHTKLTFASIDEYSTQSKLSKIRASFASGKSKILLYTERLHYFRRFEIGGVKNILMYGLPSNPIFYKELARFIGKLVFKGDADIDLSFMKIMYSKWDANTLERVIGLERAGILCNSPTEMFEFR